MIRKIIALTLVVTTSWISTWAAAPLVAQSSDQATAEKQQATARLDRLIELIASMRSEVDRTQFDLDALLDYLEFDAEKITEFAREQILFEQYSGSLRGAKGTLMSRAGNALDQSLLTATLLNDAGYEARIVRGRLSRQQTETLLQGVSSNRKKVPPARNMARIENLVEQVNELYGLDDGPSLQPGAGSQATPPMNPSDSIQRQVMDMTRLIELSLKEQDIGLGDSDLISRIVEETEEYFWVQFREGPRAGWEDCHPAFGQSNTPPAEISVTDFLLGEVPRDLQHRVRFQAFVQHRLGSTLKSSTLMDPWERPASNLIGATLRFWNLPSGFRPTPSPDGSGIAAAVNEVELFIPLFNGSVPEGGLAFDLEGSTAPADMLDTSKSGVFKNVGSAFNKAGGALNGLDSGAAAGSGQPVLAEFNKQWIEVTLIAPGGQETTIERVIADRNLEQDPLDLKISLLQDLRLNIAVGSFPDAFVLDGYLRHLNEMNKITMMLASGSDSGCDQCEAPLDSGLLESAEQLWLDHLGYFAAADSVGGGFSPETLTYRSEPSIVAQYRNVWHADGFQAVVDVLNNTRRSFNTSGGKLEIDAVGAVRLGVLETYLEGTLLPSGTEGSIGTFDFFDDSATEFTQTMVIAEADDPRINDLELSDVASSNVRRDLENGFAVVVPRTPSGPNGNIGWWRIRPETGETLGMLAAGWGGAQDGSGEYPVQLTGSTAMAHTVKKLTLPWIACFIMVATVMVASAVHFNGLLPLLGLYGIVAGTAKAVGITMAELGPVAGMLADMSAKVAGLTTAFFRAVFLACVAALSA